MTDLISVSAAARIARACCGVGKPELIEQYLLAGTPLMSSKPSWSRPRPHLRPRPRLPLLTRQ